MNVLADDEYENSRIEDFPFPLEKASIEPRVDVEPALAPRSTAAGTWGGRALLVNHNYERCVRIRSRILDRDPVRFTSLPHMLPAQWDAMLFLMRRLGSEYPDDFALTRRADGWLWTNRRLGLEREFAFGDLSSLGMEPLEYIGRQVQEDLLLLDHRSARLYVDTVLVTFSMGWSPTFVVGMNFHEVHGTVPRVMDDGTVDRSERFLSTMPIGELYRRNPWAFQIGGRLDRSKDAFPEWTPKADAYLADPRLDTVGTDVRMRSELSHFVRLPLTGAVLYTISVQSISLEQIASVPEWSASSMRVIKEVPDDLVHHKGFHVYGPLVLPYLERSS
ncbi:heme-dependent oxidative N-demethylase family protein [Streptomyces spongiae]|uniref:DUF3445 domain-containing protein n=1 Tax=Streptomyces spongiae TaxID=565072 RepID=A0A5N8XA82_9ACTN|nr:DUF3445 domain-containing protein [Streptomyces spongiae]MPY56372.1 DUF3445 domain-containing protein [Streptomyces spongiae]